MPKSGETKMPADASSHTHPTHADARERRPRDEILLQEVVGDGRLHFDTGEQRVERRRHDLAGAEGVGADEDDLVEKAQTHLSESHPGREYDREMILFMAY